MKKQEFVSKYYDAALTIQKQKGIAAEAILAQAALESAWGKVAPGYMFFGVKDTDGINGNEQLLLTTEYSRRSDLKFPEIISITPVLLHGLPYFKYRIRDYFRRYNSPEESFSDHADFFYRNQRYKKALAVKADALLFLSEVAKAGYATDPDYENKIVEICKYIQSWVRQKSS